MSKITPYGKHFIDSKDVNEVSKSLKLDAITNGKNIEIFEKKLSKYTGSKFVSVCNSGTSSILLAFMSIELKKNDVIIMPSINFIAAYNMAKFLGAKIYLADVDKNTGQMSPQNVLDCCKKFKIKKVKAVIPMYLGGYPQNAQNFIKLKKKLKCYIIEDACHALGASYKYKNKNYKIGSCKHSDISTFSLHPLKTITTGEGGVVCTNNKNLDKKIKLLRSHGLIRDHKKHWVYNSQFFGFNFRINDFQCALGISQLKKIRKFIIERKKIYSFYKLKFNKFDFLDLPKYDLNNSSSYHLCLINIKKFNIKKKDAFIKYMAKKKIMVQYHYIPIYKFDLFKEKYIGKNSELFYKSSVSIPIYYGLSKKKQNYIIQKIKYFFIKNN